MKLKTLLESTNKLYCFILFFFLLLGNNQAQNVDGMFITITADSIVRCEDTAKVKIETCHISQLGIVLNLSNVVNTDPFEIEIDLNCCRSVGFVACNDTTFLFSSLPNGNYRGIIKSSVEECLASFFV